MAVHNIKNRFPGINPHWNSLLQSDDGGWESFHSNWVSATSVLLDEQLPEGYLAISERSLQISEVVPPDDNGGNGQKVIQHPTRGDVMVYETSRSASKSGSAAVSAVALAEPTTHVQISDTMPDEEFLNAVVIYKIPGKGLYGTPITRIEILSPANKPGGSHYPRYIARRIETLKSGLCLIEVDFLHESRPVIRGLPSYPACEDGAYPYYLAVSIPRPTFEEGITSIYGFGVTDAIPGIPIPLADKDMLPFSFGEVYQRIFDSSRMVTVVNYNTEPLNFEKYCESDRQKIQDIMKLKS